MMSIAQEATPLVATNSSHVYANAVAPDVGAAAAHGTAGAYRTATFLSRRRPPPVDFDELGPGFVQVTQSHFVGATTAAQCYSQLKELSKLLPPVEADAATLAAATFERCHGRDLTDATTALRNHDVLIKLLDAGTALAATGETLSGTLKKPVGRVDRLPFDFGATSTAGTETLSVADVTPSASAGPTSPSTHAVFGLPFPGDRDVTRPIISRPPPSATRSYLAVYVSWLLLSMTQQRLTEQLRATVTCKTAWLHASRNAWRHSLRCAISFRFFRRLGGGNCSLIRGGVGGMISSSASPPALAFGDAASALKWVNPLQSYSTWYRLGIEEVMANVAWCRSQERLLSRLIGTVHCLMQEIYHIVEATLREAERVNEEEELLYMAGSTIAATLGSGGDDDEAAGDDNNAAGLHPFLPAAERVGGGAADHRDAHVLILRDGFIAALRLVDEGLSGVLDFVTDDGGELQRSETTTVAGLPRHESSATVDGSPVRGSAGGSTIEDDEPMLTANIVRSLFRMDRVMRLSKAAMTTGPRAPPQVRTRLAIAAGAFCVAAGYWTFGSEQQRSHAREWVTSMVEMARTNWTERVVSPLRGIWDSVMKSPSPIMEMRVQQERKSLEDMVVDYNVRCGLTPAERGDDELVGDIRRRVRGGDFGIVNDHFLQASKSPLWFGLRSLMLLILIKFQSSKVEFDVLHHEAMDVLNQNSVSFKLAALIPVLLAGYFLGNSWTWYRARQQRPFINEMRRGYRTVSRILCRTTPGRTAVGWIPPPNAPGVASRMASPVVPHVGQLASRQSHSRIALSQAAGNSPLHDGQDRGEREMTPEQHGRLLIHVCEMRALHAYLFSSRSYAMRWLSYFWPSAATRDAVVAVQAGISSDPSVGAFESDLDDIEDVRFTNFQRILVLQRMAVTHHYLLAAT